MEHWQLIYSATRTSQELRLARAARVQAESAARAKETRDRREDGELDQLLRQQPPAV